MRRLLPQIGQSAATRGRAAALARADTPLFLALLGLLLVLWIGAVVGLGQAPLGHRSSSDATSHRPNLAVCHNREGRAPGELLRCYLPPSGVRFADI